MANRNTADTAILLSWGSVVQNRVVMSEKPPLYFGDTLNVPFKAHDAVEDEVQRAKGPERPLLRIVP